MAACRMAAKGKTMADSGYDYEVKSIQVSKIMDFILLRLLSINQRSKVYLKKLF